MSAGKAILAILGTALSLFVALLVFDTSPPLSLQDRMKRECARQFSSEGQIVVNDCVIKLMVRTISEGRSSRMEEAYQRSR